MSWLPMGGPLGAMQDENPLALALGRLQANTLGGGGVTLGNPEAQQDYTRQLAEALAQQKSAQSDLGMAGDLMQPTYAQNSGALGSLAMMAQAYAGKKLRGKAEGKEADALRRGSEATSLLEEAKAAREQARKIKASQDERAERRKDGEAMGLTGRDLTRYALEGKIGEGVRGVPMMTNQGLVNVNPYTNEYEAVAPRGSAPPSNVRIDESIPPEIRAAIMQHEQNGQPLPDELNVTGRQQAPLMPYEKPPSEIDLRRLGLAEQAAGDARAARQAAEDARREAADNKRNTAYETENKAVGKARETVRLLDDALSHPGRSTGTGLSSVLDPRNFIPGTDAKDFGVRREQLQGRAFLEAFESLKGGGQITQIEGEKATAAMARLHAAQSDKEWQAAALELREIAERAAKSAEARSQRYVPQGQRQQNDEAPTQRIRIKL